MEFMYAIIDCISNVKDVRQMIAPASSCVFHYNWRNCYVSACSECNQAILALTEQEVSSILSSEHYQICHYAVNLYGNTITTFFNAYM